MKKAKYKLFSGIPVELAATWIGQGYGYKNYSFNWENGDGDEIIYIPKNAYEYGKPDANEVYTKNDFVAIAGMYAQVLFDGVCWQHPETLFDEYKMDGVLEECDDN